MTQNNTPLLNIYVLCWMDSNSVIYPSGSVKMISCNHQKEGDFGVNIKGEVFPLPNTTQIPPASPPASDWQQQTAEVQAGNTYTAPYPLASDASGFKVCTKVKDLSTMITYYLDATDYASKIPSCNPVPYYNS